MELTLDNSIVLKGISNPIILTSGVIRNQDGSLGKIQFGNEKILSPLPPGPTLLLDAQHMSPFSYVPPLLSNTGGGGKRIRL